MASYNISIYVLDIIKLLPGLEDFSSSLSKDELRKASSFRFNEDRVRFTIGRSALRSLLSDMTAIAPQRIQFDYRSLGKPIQRNINEKLEFNVSHSGDYIIIGISNGPTIGVDVEKINWTDDLVGVSNLFFSDTELGQFHGLEKKDRPMGFFRCWTRKEAFMKANGMGLSYPSKSFSVTLDEQAAFLSINTSDKSDHSNWTLVSINDIEGYAAAIAVQEVRSNLDICVERVSDSNFIH